MGSIKTNRRRKRSATKEENRKRREGGVVEREERRERERIQSQGLKYGPLSEKRSSLLLQSMTH